MENKRRITNEDFKELDIIKHTSMLNKKSFESIKNNDNYIVNVTFEDNNVVEGQVCLVANKHICVDATWSVDCVDNDYESKTIDDEISVYDWGIVDVFDTSDNGIVLEKNRCYRVKVNNHEKVDAYIFIKKIEHSSPENKVFVVDYYFGDLIKYDRIMTLNKIKTLFYEIEEDRKMRSIKLTEKHLQNLLNTRETVERGTEFGIVNWNLLNGIIKNLIDTLKELKDEYKEKENGK